MKSRAGILTVIAILLATGASVANPGGNGDAGDQCHPETGNKLQHEHC